MTRWVLIFRMGAHVLSRERIESRNDAAAPTQRSLAIEVAAPVLMEVVDERKGSTLRPSMLPRRNIASGSGNGPAGMDSDFAGVSY